MKGMSFAIFFPKTDAMITALILDMDLGIVLYTITSAGVFFPKVFETVETLKSRGIEIFIASGDRKGAINRLASLLDVPEDNAYGTVSTKGKCEVVSILKDAGYKVMMVGDGLNDILAFKKADVSVLTIEQKEELQSISKGKIKHFKALLGQRWNISTFAP